MGSCCGKSTPIVEIKPDVHDITTSTKCFDNDDFTCPCSSTCCRIQIRDKSCEHKTNASKCIELKSE